MMTLTHVLGSALLSASVVLLIQIAAYIQVKTTVRSLHARPATRHADRTSTPEGRPRASAPTQEYPGRTRSARTVGVGGAPPAPPAPAPYPAAHAGHPAGEMWGSSTWPPLADAADTHVTEAVP